MNAKDINDTEINSKLLVNIYRFASFAKIELENKESVVNFSKPNHHLSTTPMTFLCYPWF